MKTSIVKSATLVSVLLFSLDSHLVAQSIWKVILSDGAGIDCTGLGPIRDSLLALTLPTGTASVGIDRIVGIERIAESQAGTGALIGAVVGGLVGVVVAGADQQSHEVSAGATGGGDMGLSWVRPTMGFAIGAGSGALVGVVVGSAIGEEKEYSLEGVSLNRKLRMIEWILSNNETNQSK